MRMGIASILQETNTFSIAMSDAHDFTVAIGTDLLDAVEGTNSELCGAIDILTHAGTNVSPWCTHGRCHRGD